MNNKESRSDLLFIVLISIIGTLVIAYISSVMFSGRFPESFISLWDIWDTPHYLKIAKEGYSSSTIGERHLLIVFFPLFPFLTKLFSFVFQNYLLSGLIVSNIAYGFAVFYLYKLVRLDFQQDDALRTAIYFSIFPTAYFLHAAYTESLFMALTIASFYYSRNGKWALGGIIGMLAAMTRITGILLLPVLLIEYLHQKDFKKENIRRDVLWIFIIGIGLVVYFILNYMTYGDPLKFLKFQSSHWSMNLSLPVQGFLNTWGVTDWGDPGRQFHGGWFQLIFGLLGLILTIYSFFTVRLSYSLYALITWLIITSTSFMISVPRYILTIFPIFIVLSIFGRKKWANYAIIFISLMLYSLFLFQFVSGRWAF